MTTEHYCPYCRRELMASDHAKDCIPGQSFGGQSYRFELLTDDLASTLVREARRTPFGRIAVWIIDRLPGHNVSRPVIR